MIIKKFKFWVLSILLAQAISLRGMEEGDTLVYSMRPTDSAQPPVCYWDMLPYELQLKILNEAGIFNYEQFATVSLGKGYVFSYSCIHDHGRLTGSVSRMISVSTKKDNYLFDIDSDKENSAASLSVGREDDPADEIVRSPLGGYVACLGDDFIDDYTFLRRRGDRTIVSIGESYNVPRLLKFHFFDSIDHIVWDKQEIKIACVSKHTLYVRTLNERDDVDLLFPIRPAHIRSAVWSPSGREIALGDLSGNVMLVDVGTRAIFLKKVDTKSSFPMYRKMNDIAGIAWNASENSIACVIGKCIRMLCRLDDGTWNHGISLAHETEPLSVAWKDKEIVSGSKDGSVCVWDSESGQLIKRLQAHDTAVHFVAYPEGFIVSGTREGIMAKIIKDPMKYIRRFIFKKEGTGEIRKNVNLIKVWQLLHNLRLAKKKGAMYRVAPEMVAYFRLLNGRLQDYFKDTLCMMQR